MVITGLLQPMRELQRRQVIFFVMAQRSAAQPTLLFLLQSAQRMVQGMAARNAVGSVQADTYLNHNHRNQWIIVTYWTGGNIIQYSSSGNGNIWEDTPLTNLSTTGGNETRPENAYVNYIIKY